MKRPLIGIVARIERSETNMSLNVVHEDERIAVIKSGGVPMLILPSQPILYNETIPREVVRLSKIDKENLEVQIDLCDGILIPGGDKMYEYDRYIIDYVIRKKKPFLAICMGMQLMCTYNKEIQLEKNQSNIRHFSKQKKAHTVYLDLKSKLHEICHVEKMEVNSRHRLHVVDSNQFRVSARSVDGVIEAVEGMHDLFQIGVQWHPELDYDQNEKSRKIFDAFLTSAKGKGKKDRHK